MGRFDRYVGIDYSGAQTPTASLKGLRVYAATPQWAPVEVQPPPSPRFDGWSIPSDKSVVAEVYPRQWNRTFPREDRTADQHDAYSIAAWMRATDGDGALTGFFDPLLTPAERTKAQIEGWILGVM